MLKPYFIYKYPNNKELLNTLYKFQDVIKYIYNTKNSINLESLCLYGKTKKELKYLQDNINDKKFSWINLCKNENAISILENIIFNDSQLIDRIDWSELCRNKNAINIIEKILEPNSKYYSKFINKINWSELSSNENATHILKKNINKVQP